MSLIHGLRKSLVNIMWGKGHSEATVSLYAQENYGWDKATADEYGALYFKLFSQKNLYFPQLPNIVFWDENVPFIVKKQLANDGYWLSQAIQWKWQNLEGADLKEFMTTHSIKESTYKYAAKNPHLLWEDIEAILRPQRQFYPLISIQDKAKADEDRKIQNRFFYALPDSILTEHVLRGFFWFGKPLNIDMEYIYAKARKFYDLDEGIPDSWIERIFA